MGIWERDDLENLYKGVRRRMMDLFGYAEHYAAGF
jgi:hypothetical protein